MAIKSITPRIFTNTINLKNCHLFKKIIMARKTTRGVFEFGIYWVEIYFLFMLIMGYFMALNIKVGIINYIVIFLSGFIFGRLLYSRRREGFITIIFVMCGYILGYLYGIKMGNGSKLAVVLFFIIGNYVSYQLHKEKIIT